MIDAGRSRFLVIIAWFELRRPLCEESKRFATHSKSFFGPDEMQLVGMIDRSGLLIIR